LAVLVAQAIYWFNEVTLEQIPDLDRIAFDGYLQGLRDAGWQGDAALVRLGYAVTVALRCAFAILLPEWTARDQALRTWVESAMGHSMEEISDRFRGLRLLVVTLAEEARQLMDLPAIKSLIR